MLDPKKRSELEQSQAMLVEVFPSLWWGMYESLTAKGFTPHQSLDLIKTLITAQFGARDDFTPPPPPSPIKDDS